ncbi:neprilysin-2-like [Microplitis mediator]|uniref:neprilysin-2-like n=1 Tax=Microplitis mediator TaxID=375433 RepID=UPI002556986A|nr:neprilysin-2-like [Microplitis mediator]
MSIWSILLAIFFPALVVTENVTNIPNFPDNKGTYNCRTRECLIDNIKYEYDVVKNIKESVDPCENFYEFACGNFDDLPYAPKLTNRVFESITSANGALDALTLYSSSSHKLKPLNFLRDFMDSCQNLNQNNDYSKSGAKEDRLEFLKEVISKLGGWPVVEGDKWNEKDFDWIKFVSQAENIGYVSGQSFMYFIVLPSMSDGAVSFNLYPPQLEFSYEYVKNVQNFGLMSYYYNYMINVAKFLGAHATRAKEDLRAAFEFEKQLIYGTNQATSYSSVNITFTSMSLGEIKQTWPSINWAEYFNNHLLPYFSHDDKTLVAVWNKKYITNFEKLMNETSKRVQANYAIWKTIQFSIPFIKSVTLYNFAQTYGFFKQQLIGSHDCFAEAKTYLPSIARAHYARNYPVNQEVKQNVGLIFSNIKRKLLDTLKSKNLDAHTKEKMIKKIENLMAVVGYPEEVLDDEKLDKYFEDLKITKDNYLGNLLSIQSFTMNRKLTAFGKPNNLYDWKDIFTIMTMGTAQESYYCRRENILVITDWLSKFLINTNRYNYTNYGAIGALIGYEVGRAVDFSVDFEEKYLNNETEKCIVEKYSNYTGGYGTQAYGIVNLKGTITQQMGVELAYSAYQEWAKEHGEEPNLARLYTSNQLFWLAYGNINCSPKSWTYTSSQTSYDKRVNWPLSNIPEFSKDFNCSLKSPMNPKNKCIILL